MRPPPTPPLRAVLAALLIALPGCMVAAKPTASASPSCKANCQSMHDRCVMDARDGTAIQTCDEEAKWCTEHCPR